MVHRKQDLYICAGEFETNENDLTSMSAYMLKLTPYFIAQRTVHNRRCARFLFTTFCIRLLQLHKSLKYRKCLSAFLFNTKKLGKLRLTKCLEMLSRNLSLIKYLRLLLQHTLTKSVSSIDHNAHHPKSLKHEFQIIRYVI